MTLTRLSSTLAALAVLFMIVALGAMVFVVNTDVFEGDAFPVDFVAFWAAAKLAVEGRAAAAFDFETLNGMFTVPEGYTPLGYLWMYPPTYHTVIWPLGWLPFWAAYLLFSVGALAVYIAALRPYAHAWPGGLNLVLAAPVVIIGTLNGNNGLLSAGVLIFALTALSQGREMRAGLLISLLTMKPTLGLVIPVALLAGGHWRAAIWATVGTVALAIGASMIMGWDYWSVFLEHLGKNAERVASGRFPLDATVSWFGFFYNVGLGTSAGFAVNGIALVSCAVLIGWVFARPGAWAWKGAFLLLVTPVATPYAHFYEMSFTLAGTVFLALAGGVRSGAEKALVAGLWFVPVITIFLRDPPLVPWLAAPMMTALLILATLRARETWRTAPATS